MASKAMISPACSAGAISAKIWTASLCKRCLTRNISDLKHSLRNHRNVSESNLPRPCHLKQYLPKSGATFSSFKLNRFSNFFTNNATHGIGSTFHLSTTTNPSRDVVTAAVTDKGHSGDSQYQNSKDESKKSRWSNWTGKNAWKLSLLVLGSSFGIMGGTVVYCWGKKSFFFYQYITYRIHRQPCIAYYY